MVRLDAGKRFLRRAALVCPEEVVTRHNPKHTSPQEDFAMNLQDLRNYRCWTRTGVTAQKVHLAVLAVRGWANVFPNSLPRWASRIRNYFNIAPTTLERLPEDVSKRLSKQVERFLFLRDCHAIQTFNRNQGDHRQTPLGPFNP